MSIIAISASLALSASTGCVPVEDAGAITEPMKGGLVQQAQLDGPPLVGEEAAARRAQEAASDEAAAAQAAAREAAAQEAAEAAARAEAEDAAAKAAREALIAEEAEAVAAAEAAEAAAAETEPEAPETAEAEPEVAAEPTPSGELSVTQPPPSQPGAAVTGELASDPEVVVVPPAPEPADVGGAEPARTLDVLPPAPDSDAAALAALDRAALRPAPQAPDYATIAARQEPCEPSGPFSAVALRELELVQTWVEGTASRALVRNRAGDTLSITLGAVVGPTGARVASIGAREVVFAEIQFGMDGSPVLVQHRITVASPR